MAMRRLASMFCRGLSATTHCLDRENARKLAGMAGLLRASALACVLALVAACGASTPTASNALAPPPKCRPNEVQLAGLGIISAATGENGILVYVRATSTTACSISGFPSVSFKMGSRTVPFTYKYGGGFYLTYAGQPKSVTLKPGQSRSAYFEVAKYRCDLGDLGTATTAEIRLPGASRTSALDIRHANLPMEWCKPVSAGPNEVTYRTGMTAYIGALAAPIPGR